MPGRGGFPELRRPPHNNNSNFTPVNVRHYQTNAREQIAILHNDTDFEAINEAIKAFTNLQHVKIRRWVPDLDGKLVSYLRQHRELDGIVGYQWEQACERGMNAIGSALLENGRAQCTKFSSPNLSPPTALKLANNPPQRLELLYERLTSLELHFENFDPGPDLNETIRSLSGLFKVVFQAAKKMQSVHLGFERPLDLRLEEVLHHVQWKELISFGIRSWKLDADEIIEFVRRHRDRLKGLRLQEVKLRDGSRWRDVLEWLRGDVRERPLDWVSLRRIGYVSSWEQQPSGFEVPDDSDDSVDDWDEYADDLDTVEEEDEDGLDNTEASNDAQHPNDDNHPPPANGFNPVPNPLPPMHMHLVGMNFQNHNLMQPVNNHAPPPHYFNANPPGVNGHPYPHFANPNLHLHPNGSEHSFPPYAIGFPPTPDTIAAKEWCYCIAHDGDETYRPLMPEDLGDYGNFGTINNDLRKIWEEWVIRRCPIHGVKTSRLSDER